MSDVSRRTMILGGVAVAAAAAAGAAYMDGGAGESFEEYEARAVFAEDGVAIRGTDPVAYFTENKAVPGSEEHTMEWRGATWRFSSAENLEAFESDPEKYAPQYGGFCAWAVAAKNKLYSTQPENWTIVDGKLYLNYNDDIQAKWEEDIPGFIAEGDKNWRKIMDRDS